MSVDVFAVVLSHDQPQSLNRVLDQLSNQTVKPSRVIIVDTSKKEKISSDRFETLRLKPKTSFAASIEQAAKQLPQAGYLWILHDDSAPELNALEKLLLQIELSPSLAIVGPKQLDWDNPKLIKQLGLTLTRTGRLFSRVRGEFDQGQHDSSQDVMAVGTAGALINLETYWSLGGFDKSAPPLAADVDFSIRARLQGARVAVVPDSKIAHKMLSMNGDRPASWLGGSVELAIRQAEYHLGLSYANPILFVLGWLFLIPFAILNSVLLLLKKRPGQVPVELVAATRTFFNLGTIFSSRAKIRKTTKLKFKTLSGLRATRQEVRAANQRARDQEISRALLEAHERGDSEDLVASTNQGLLASGALWFALGLVLLNIGWFPTNIAAIGAGVIPVSSNWLDIFSHAGASSHQLGLGFEGAADPFSFALAFLTAPVFFQPTIAITVLLFLAMPIAFIGAFKLIGLISSSSAIRITLALGYALWPSMTQSIQQAGFAPVMAITLLPWLLFTLAKISGLGKTSPDQVVLVWSNVGAAAILLALISASSPILGLILLVVILGLALIRIRSSFALLITTGLSIVWFVPVVIERISSGNPLSILIDPSLSVAKEFDQDWTLLFHGFGFDSLAFGLFITVPVLVFALIAILTKDLPASLMIWTVALFALITSWFGAAVSFGFGEGAIQALDISTVLALFGISLLLLVAKAAESAKPLKFAALSSVVLVGLIPAGYGLVSTPPAISYSDARIVPSIIQADAAAGVIWKTLKLENQTDGTIAAELFTGSGVKLEQLATGYKLSLATSANANSEYQELGQLVANLASANGADIFSTLSKFNIGYVLVSPSNRDLQMALDSTRELESIGETDFGQLWKVREVASTTKQSAFEIDSYKLVALGALLVFLVLAIPTSSSKKRRGKESVIFVDAEDNNQ